MDFDQRRRHRHDVHAGRYYGADADREVHVAGARHVAADQHGLSDLGALLGRQRHAAAAAATLLRLTLRGLTLLALLTLRGLALLGRALLALGLRRALARLALALLALTLAGG